MLTKEERERRNVAIFRDVQGGMSKAAVARKYKLQPSSVGPACRSGEWIEMNAIAVSKAMTGAAAWVHFDFPEQPKLKSDGSAHEIDALKDKYGFSWRSRLERVYRHMEHQRRIESGEYARHEGPKPLKQTAKPSDLVMQACETW